MVDDYQRNKFLTRIKESLNQDSIRENRVPDSPELRSHIGKRDPQENKLDRLFHEISLLSGEGSEISPGNINAEIKSLITRFHVQKATMWSTPKLKGLGFHESLSVNGVEVISSQSDPRLLAECDLGITEVDYAIIDSGTLVLTSAPEKPRLVSLLPPVHLAILHKDCLVDDIVDVFDEARDEKYMIFITGPSRTADIELTVSLGVHGPKYLVVWAVSEE